MNRVSVFKRERMTQNLGLLSPVCADGNAGAGLLYCEGQAVNLVMSNIASFCYFVFVIVNLMQTVAIWLSC